MSDELKEQTRGEQLRKALLCEKKNGYDRLQPGELEGMEAYCANYKQYLDAGKTERRRRQGSGPSFGAARSSRGISSTG